MLCWGNLPVIIGNDTAELPENHIAFNLGNLWINRREQIARDHAPDHVLKTAGILYVFQGFYKQKLEQKIR